MFKKIAIVCLALFLANTCFAAASSVTKFPAKHVQGNGPLPYNYRVTDGQIHAGGHPLNPTNKFKNSDKQALAILKYLKSKGVKTIIDLENTRRIQKRYAKLLKQAGIRRIHIPMHAEKVPTKKEWLKIKKALQKPVYLHCKWGADRTGAIIGRYLVEAKYYSAKDAYQSVVSGGSHAGALGGLKKKKAYARLKQFIYDGEPHPDS